MKRNVIIDRFEGDFAVVELENKKITNMPRQLIPAGAEEGTVLTITMNNDETERRKAGISRLMKDLWKE